MNLFFVTAILVQSLFTTGDFNTPEMKGTTWSSEFYHYANFYCFETDSTGYSLDGQLAASIPIDTVEAGVSGNTIVYGDKTPFNYKIVGTGLTIYYPENKTKRRYFYRNDFEDWCSFQEYAYGRECLSQGEQIKTFE